MLRRWPQFALALSLLLLASCTGTRFNLLPAGSGQGRYDGTLRTAGGAVLGTFFLRIDDSGKATGSGSLGSFDVDLHGVLRSDGHLAAVITESVSQQHGAFAGTVGAGGAATPLSGTWQLNPSGTQELAGVWDAVLSP